MGRHVGERCVFASTWHCESCEYVKECEDSVCSSHRKGLSFSSRSMTRRWEILDETRGCTVREVCEILGFECFPPTW
jgi:D-arabinose 1-dehydrogenase-like Zn-dependent alcohol dehydrogenase